MGGAGISCVFALWHIYEMDDGEDEEKFIGVYSTRKNAEDAIERLAPKPGFVDYPDCFEIFEWKLDQDGWVDGFEAATD